MKLRNKTTGEIIETCKIIQNAFGEIIMLTLSEDERYPYEYHSLAELNEEWEDYKPAEPLIKDEKIRKAVRAWAEVNSIKIVLYAERTDRSLCCLTDMGEDDYDIQFVGWIPTLKDGEEYTIAELCGEEE